VEVSDAQREVRTVFVGGFWGQLVSAVLWLVSAALSTWVSPRAGITQIVLGGFLIFPLTQLLLRLSGGRSRVSRENPLHWLGMQVAFTLPLSMLLLVPVAEFHLNLFYPALMVLLGAHYLPFIFSTACACSARYARFWWAAALSSRTICRDRSAWAAGWVG